MIYLESKSPRRKQIMELTDFDFKILTANVSEDGTDNMSPEEAVMYLSRIKAEGIYENVEDGDIIIGSDTVVAINDTILGKPKDKDDAYNMLKMLSGKIHSVYTGVTLVKKGNPDIIKTFYEETKVEFYELSDKEIEDYIKTGEPFDKAGAYGIQEKGALFVKALHGDFFNVVGLPVARLSRELKSL